MTRTGSENAVSFISMKHLNTADITASYGVLRVRAAVVIAAIMAVLVFVGGANACHHNSETAEQTSTEVPQKTEKTEVEA
jgi:peptide subunit release factor 1 (eRF1)